MDKQTFCFELVDKYSPEIVIKKILLQIDEVTRGYVIGNIEEYSGNIFSYKKRTGFGTAMTALTMSKEVDVDIQEDLGVQDEEQHRYEVYLTAKGLEHYKYRMFFVDYGTVSYPVTIVMNQTLAVEYSGKRTTVFSIESMKKLEDMMEMILNSETMLTLIQNLINEALRQESKTNQDAMT